VALVEQLKPGGRLVCPTGTAALQRLTVLDKDAAGQVATLELLDVRFSWLETIS
jgi:protein-L-isoaspartate O-methyltransferase